MLAAPTYKSVSESLREYMSPEGRHHDVRLVGLVFCQPHSKFAKDEILPALKYFNFRSGQRVNFYFPGYGHGFEERAGEFMAVPPADGPGWLFSPKHFNDFRETLQKLTNWRYGGGAELLLANARYNAESGEAHLDFSSAVRLSFDRLKHDDALLGVGILFESIFQYADTCDSTDPTWGFSDHSAKNLVAGGLKSLVVSVLPAPLRQDAKAAFHYVSSNLEK